MAKLPRGGKRGLGWPKLPNGILETLARRGLRFTGGDVAAKTRSVTRFSCKISCKILCKILDFLSGKKSCTESCKNLPEIRVFFSRFLQDSVQDFTAKIPSRLPCPQNKKKTSF